ncbi:MAG: class I SAM-dependent methyltransferase [Chloroflexi bacterium AL-W]|nr:class I SAM-dependent methyltransferase [Chloroflexi bacterium AL-N1]NOK68236.1 class I SAM-dependent methyltransferase [Chloroflexi bacterium AL-N10]NOK73882.1 class I SAM-dependent methyltransferase [Chloroflexi bacterium AL-N5]NOK82850.1 class I SAM-dependent methyltransferase [Chloroflexi bacterium AL-W]NOK90372.1 class I SAM-dependent methyltransferase [Chloroflexi bacterium AL-N15]
MPDYSFARYLSAKKTVDDRALNRVVWKTLQEQLQQLPMCHVLEVGAGAGTMAERVADWHLFNGPMIYTGIDTNIHSIQLARHHAKTRTHSDLQVHFQVADALTWQPAQPVDLIIANAFMDLVHFPTAMDHFKHILRPAGFFYFTITFDGVTMLEPTIDTLIDTKIEALYHADMDARQNGTTGGSYAGRRLLQYVLQRADVDVLAAGASDWIVYPNSAGYEHDEAYFLHFIIDTMDQALSGHPELDDDLLAEWVQTRHSQIDNGALIYIAHQIDLLGQFT